VVTLISEDLIRRLASVKSQGSPVVSLYLDIDGRRYPRYEDCELRAERMVKRAVARDAANGHVVSPADVGRIGEVVRHGVDRSRTRGLAIFSCASAGLWEFLELPVSVRDQLVVNKSAHVRQLETIADESKTFGLLIADKQRARMFVFDLGQLVDKSELFDALPRGDDTMGDRDRGHQRHTLEAAAAHQHLRRAAQVAFEVYKQHPFDHLIIGAPDEIAHELERDLHSYLRERIAARVSVPTNASEAVIRRAALQVEEDVERRMRGALVDRIREQAGAGTGAVTGLDKVLAALTERRVDTLVVSDGFELEGWRCPSCESLATRGRRCPLCDGEMELVADVIEEAIEEAVNQHCHVVVCSDNPDLDVMGRVGALLRY
jgi:peptide subunit release factor 1 (eRF1)